jgi:Zn-dependent protease
MFLDLLLGSPALALAWIAAIFSVLTLHEFSHALMAKFRGDRTAEREGRLTLNPVAHIDPTGLILLLLFGFGWAKPVPYNPYNLKDPKWDSVKIALAGPGSNLVLAIIGGLAFRFLVVGGMIAPLNLLSIFIFLTIILNLFLMLFNLIPIHPLDGSKLFFALFDKPQYAQFRNFVAIRGPQIILVAVLVSAFTSINIFGFISTPSFMMCDALTGQSCLMYFSSIFSLI